MQPVYLHIVDDATERHQLRFRIQSAMARHPYSMGIAMTMEVVHSPSNMGRVVFAISHGARNSAAVIYQIAFWNIDLRNLANTGFGDWRRTRNARLLIAQREFFHHTAQVYLIDCFDPTKYTEDGKKQVKDWLQDGWRVSGVSEGVPVFPAVT